MVYEHKKIISASSILIFSSLILASCTSSKNTKISGKENNKQSVNKNTTSQSNELTKESSNSKEEKEIKTFDVKNLAGVWRDENNKGISINFNNNTYHTASVSELYVPAGNYVYDFSNAKMGEDYVELFAGQSAPTENNLKIFSNEDGNMIKVISKYNYSSSEKKENPDYKSKSFNDSTSNTGSRILKKAGITDLSGNYYGDKENMYNIVQKVYTDFQTGYQKVHTLKEK